MPVDRAQPREPAAVAPTLELDPARGLVVYVSETGQRFDVVSEEPDGSPAVCVEAFALAPAPPDALGPADRGIVFGRRADGLAGIWIIRADGTVTGFRVKLLDDQGASAEGAEGIQAFLGKRKPAYPR